MPGAVHPYSAADTAEAARWLPYLESVRDLADSVADLDAATVEAVDKLTRRGVITFTVAALLCEIFDIAADHAFA